MSSTTNGKALYENLDTTFVNLWSLLRNLTQRGFVGRVHVELANYSADVFLNGSANPLVHEVDHASGADTLEESGLHRLVLRARETPGKISVFEGANDSSAASDLAPLSPGNAEAFVSGSTQSGDFEVEAPQTYEPSAPPAEIIPRDELAGLVAEMQSESHSSLLPSDDAGSTWSTSFEVEAPQTYEPVRSGPPVEIIPRDELAGLVAETQTVAKPETQGQMSLVVSLSGELIGAVERGINACGEDFSSLFRSVRLELADDYSYLDPMSNALTYSNGVVSLTDEVSEEMYVSSLSETLRRTVDKVAAGDRARRVRERIALELLSVARKRKEALENSKFGLQLDRIAGTKVI